MAGQGRVGGYAIAFTLFRSRARRVRTSLRVWADPSLGAAYGFVGHAPSAPPELSLTALLDIASVHRTSVRRVFTRSCFRLGRSRRATSAPHPLTSRTLRILVPSAKLYTVPLHARMSCWKTK